MQVFRLSSTGVYVNLQAADIGRAGNNDLAGGNGRNRWWLIRLRRLWLDRHECQLALSSHDLFEGAGCRVVDGSCAASRAFDRELSRNSGAIHLPREQARASPIDLRLLAA